MASASEPPVPPPLRPPSIFISYASEDRAAARLLRDTLADAGLEVWYDENELGGGDAWDQKIRRQIRECDYFMALISATTEKRKEGYFRREWRLASERTLDMADDVLFLLPVAIDATNEGGARVPDKFLAVQWLRAPGGQTTPALVALTRRLAAGDHSPPPRLPRTEPPFPAARAGAAEAKPPAAPLAFPPFPPTPHQGGIAAGLHFVVETLKWVVMAGWILFKRFPRWARVVISVWIVIALLPRCSRDDEDYGTPKKAVHVTPKDAIAATLKNVDTALALRETTRQLEQTTGAKDTDNPNSGYAKIGVDIARAVSAQLAVPDKTSRQITVIPFGSGVTNKIDAKLAGAIFKIFYRQVVEARGDIVGISLDPAESTEIAIERGRKLGTAYFVVASVEKENDEKVLRLRLLDINGGTVTWTGSQPLNGDMQAIGADLASGLLAAWPKL